MSALTSLNTALQQIQALQSTFQQLASSGNTAFGSFADALTAAQKAVSATVAGSGSTSANTAGNSTTSGTSSVDTVLNQLAQTASSSTATSGSTAAATTGTTATATAQTAPASLSSTAMDQLKLFNEAMAKGPTYSNGIPVYDFSALDAKYGKSIIGTQTITRNFDSDPQFIFEKIVGDKSVSAYASNLSVPYTRVENGITVTGGASLLSLSEIQSIAKSSNPESTAAQLINTKLQPKVQSGTMSGQPVVSIIDRNGAILQSVSLSKTPEGTAVTNADALRTMAARYGISLDATQASALLGTSST